MWPYFAVVIIIYILCVISNKNNTKPIVLLNVAGIMLLFSFAALRGNGSGDYFAYLERGKDILTLSDVFTATTHMEIGYNFLYFIVNFCSLPSQFIIIFMNTISFFFLSMFLKKHSPHILISLICFLPLYFQFDMHAARTAVAISITTYSLKYVFDKKPLRFIITIYLASCFHSVAWVALGLYIIPIVNINSFIGILAILFSLIIKLIFNMDVLIAEIFNFAGLEKYAVKYMVYVNDVNYGYPFKLYDPRLILLIIIYALGIFLFNKKDKIEYFFVNCCWINILLYILLSDHTFITYRVGAFYNIYTIVLVPLILKRMKEIYINNCSLRGISDCTRKIWLNGMVLGGLYLFYIFGIIAMGEVGSGTVYKFFWIG